MALEKLLTVLVFFLLLLKLLMESSKLHELGLPQTKGFHRMTTAIEQVKLTKKIRHLQKQLFSKIKGT